MKVIFMSVFADEGVIHHGLAGAAFLPKPFTPGDVMRNVCRILARNRSMAPRSNGRYPGSTALESQRRASSVCSMHCPSSSGCSHMHQTG